MENLMKKRSLEKAESLIDTVRSIWGYDYAYSFITEIEGGGIPCDNEHDSESKSCIEPQSSHRPIHNAKGESDT
jgi:hypothetical protein|tara:strand:- start:493 stop:714 length:222 start_codon:yes stop_codon:yes gene_type:complete